MGEKIVKRSDKVAFMNVGTVDAVDYKRMTKFTDLSNSKNPTEYSRQYVDEEGETTDVTGYSPEISYGFDQHTDNAVHEKIAKIADDELTGDDATVEVLIVDKTKEVANGYEARLRKYAVVPDSEGDSTDAYTYSGSLKAKGGFESVIAKLSDDGKTATIVTDAVEGVGE